jgi:MFS family permease
MSKEYGVDDNKIRYTTLALFLGLCIGASFWGVMSDVVGRRLAFNCTLGIASVFGVAAGAAPNWIGSCALFACVGLGVGGNLPVDGALFLEFLPGANGSLLTLLSVWWPIGQLIASLGMCLPPEARTLQSLTHRSRLGVHRKLPGRPGLALLRLHYRLHHLLHVHLPLLLLPLV